MWVPHRKTALYCGALALIFLLALALRVALWFDQGRAGMVFPGDQDEYYRGAIHLALRGDYYDEGQWMRPPLTSFFFGAIFALFGVNLPLALLVQCLLSATHPLLMAALARRLWGSRRAGLAAGLLGALFLPFASYGSQLLSEMLFTCCITLALLLFHKASSNGQGEKEQEPEAKSTLHTLLWFGAGGVAWGLAALARPVGLYALPLLALWAIWEQHKAVLSRRGAQQGRRSFPAAAFYLGPAAALLLGFAIVVAPWTARNYAVYGQLVLVDTNGGVSFWLGNLLEPGERELQQHWNRTLPNSALRQQVALERGIANIMGDPLLFLARMRYKTVSLWQYDLRLFAANDTRGPTLEDSSLAFALLSDVQYTLIVLLALVGVFAALPGQRNLLLLGWPLYGTLLCALTLGHPRLRVPLLVSALIYGALPLAHPGATWKLLVATRRRWLGLAGAVAVFGLLLWSGPLVPFARGQLALALGPLLGPDVAIERAIAADPDGYIPYMALGDLHQQRGDVAAALAAYDQAAARAPHNVPLQARRIALLRERGDGPGAQAALGQIAAVGWDNPKLYAWAWEALPAAGGERLDVRGPATGLIDGVYAAEQDGATAFRWSLGRARLRLDLAAADGLRLRLRAPRPDTAVDVLYGGHSVATLQVGTAWQTFDLPLREALGFRDIARSTLNDDKGVVELRSASYVASPEEPYPRGIAIAEAVLSRSPGVR